MRPCEYLERKSSNIYRIKKKTFRTKYKNENTILPQVLSFRKIKHMLFCGAFIFWATFKITVNLNVKVTQSNWII